MVLWLIGLGLYDEKDITLRYVTVSKPLELAQDWTCIGALRRGLEAVKGCSRVYLEAYTSILLCDKSKLVRICWVPVRARAIT